MADNKLTLPNQTQTGLEPAIPEVRTLARPVAAPLLAARHEVQRNPTLQARFRQARTEAWQAPKLAEAIEPELRAKLEGSDEQIHEVAVFLSDEYTQIGDATLIVSHVTGRAIARITDKDIWQPPDVPRESGGLAKPLPRLRPDLEGFLVQWTFDEEREQRTMMVLNERVRQTELLRTHGDRRLLAATRAGRAEITESIRERLSTLLGGVQGDAGAFLNRFQLMSEPPSNPDWGPLLKCTAVARVATPVADSLAMNLRFDPTTAIGAQMATAWVRDIARTLAMAAVNLAESRGTVQYDRLTDAELCGARLWFGDAAPLLHLRQRDVPHTLVVDGAPLTGLIGGWNVGAIVLEPSSYECRSREIFDRWEIGAIVEYTLYVDWSRVVALELLNLPQEAVAEVVR